MASSSQGQIFL